jgi:hypothetical protein
MTTPAPSQDAGKLAAQKAFFAMIAGKAPVAAEPAAAPAPTIVTRAVSPAAEGPQKIPRPGSLFDIRV